LDDEEAVLGVKDFFTRSGSLSAMAFIIIRRRVAVVAVDAVGDGGGLGASSC
jgi:hypothetical protein